MTLVRTSLMAAAIGAGLVLAAGVATAGPVEDRQAGMKAVGQTMKDASGLATGQTPWDAAKAKALMDGLAANTKKLKGQFPANTATDPKSAASPKVWEAKADFDKKLTEMGALATAAGKAKTVDEFKAGFGKVSGTCKGCHDTYRKKKS